MRTKILLSISILCFFVLSAALLGGCSEQTFEGSTYYYPNWMPDGRIICNKVTSRWSNSWFGRRELGDTSYVAAITINNSNEVIKDENLFEVPGGDWVKEITCSPTGEMIGWILSGHGAENIKISDYTGNILHTITVPTSRDVMQYFDWSPDATRIAYSASSALYVVNVDGKGNAQIATSAEAVAWRVGEKIAFIKYMGTDYSRIAIIDSNGANEVVTSLIGGDVQKDAASVYYRGRADVNLEPINAVRIVNLAGTGDALKISNYERSTLKLSFDNAKITGGDLITGGGRQIGGIWVTNINDGSSAKIR